MTNLPEKVLIVNPGAGSVDDSVMATLKQAFADYEVVHFPPDDGFIKRLAQHSLVVACGGDGTIAAVARSLAGTGHSFGILPMGTFNNFARALDIPIDLDAAIEVVKAGHVRDCTLGRINGNDFLEVASIGFFGDALALGESAKDLHFGDMLEKLRGSGSDKSFHYRITGDLELEGDAVSILLANTPSTGALMPVADGATPRAPQLDLVVTQATGRLSELKNLVGAMVTRQAPEPAESHRVSRVRIETEPAARIYADASEVGETPAEVEAVAGGLSIFVPS